MRKSFNGKKILIAGKGVSGDGAYKALCGLGAHCEFYEDGRDYSDSKADLIVVSPGIDASQPVFAYAAEKGIKLIGELELGYIINDKPIIAVTGTNGKTTTVKLIGAMLGDAGKKVAVCGNVGTSFALAAYEGGYDFAAVEVSSFQLETTDTFRPHIAVITNISPDHLNRHKTMDAYCAVKRRIAANQTSSDYLVLSQDDIPLYALKDFAPQSNTHYTSVRGKLKGAYVIDDRVYFMGEYICDTDRIKLEGEHNIKNALSAICAVKLLGIGNKPIVKALTEYTADKHRLGLVARVKGKNYYNDSKGTNIMASVRAAECMSGDTCMIVGGSDKGYEYDELFIRLPECVVRMAAVGETAEKIKAAGERNKFYNIKTFTDFNEAFDWAGSGNEENVLLSPASASFDMFSSYGERGDLFIRLVKNASKK